MIGPRIHQRLVRALLEIPGVELGRSHFSPDEALFRSGHHVAQVDRARGIVEVRLTRGAIRAHREELRSDARVDLRQPGSDWVNLTVASGRDIALAVELVLRAVAANAARR